MTITLMLRSVGALIFDTLADKYVRKWLMIVNLFLFVVLELGSGFCQTLPQFLGVRSLYGIAMGGLYGPAASTALEDLPYEARGLLSGLFQNGSSTGYLLVTAFYRALVPTTTHGWRSLFWFGSAPPLLIIAFRLCLPETNHFRVLKAQREARARMALLDAGTYVDTETETKASAFRAFLNDAGQAIKTNWVLLIYMVVLMTGFNSCSYGSQDFYPTYLKSQVELHPTDVTIITVVGQLGSITGGTVIGYLSTFFGRRLSIQIGCVIGAALVPAYIVPRNMTLVASAFFEQFFVGGVWGPIPIHLMELAPPAIRSAVVGLTYQLGNLASSASATIQAVIGERFPLSPSAAGEELFDYERVIAILMGAVWAYLVCFLLLGPEMAQEERDEEARAAKELDERCLEGVDLTDMGARMAQGGGKPI